MFDWAQFFSLLIICPMQALFYLRVLSPKIPHGRFFLYNLLYYVAMSAVNVFLTVVFDANSADYQTNISITAFYIPFELCGCLLLWKFTATDSFWRRLLAYVLDAVMIAVGAVAGSVVIQLIEATGGGATPYFSTNGVIAMVTLVQAVVVFVSSGLIARRIKHIAVDVRWNVLTILLLVQVASIIFVSSLVDWLNMDLQSSLIFCIYMLLCVLMDVYVLRAFRSMVKNAELEQRVALLDQQQRFERAQYLAASEQMASIRRLRHDYLNTLSTLGTLMHMGQREKALAILDSTVSELENTHLVHTGNQIADAVLYSKGLAAKEKGVSLTCGLLWPRAFAMADTDLMRLLSNLLDNAIRYCETLPDGVAREVEVSSVLRGGLFALLVTNPYLADTPPVIPPAGSGIPTGEHGHGLSIARGIAEAYGGTLTNECGSGTLTFRAVLTLPGPERCAP